MRLIIDKKLQGGKYSVHIKVIDLNADELDRIQKFGSPMVSLSPQSYYTAQGYLRFEIALHAFDHVFEFDSEQSAVSFVESMRKRITEANEKLKNKKDSFSSTDNYTL